MATTVGILEQHYRREDCKPYSKRKFEVFYGTKAEKEWLATPDLKHVAKNGIAYNLTEFQKYYTSTWRDEWLNSDVATQERTAKDHQTYNMTGFFDYYKNEWPEMWKAAQEQACVECCEDPDAPVDKGTCGKKAKYCQWDGKSCKPKQSNYDTDEQQG